MFHLGFDEIPVISCFYFISILFLSLSVYDKIVNITNCGLSNFDFRGK